MTRTPSTIVPFLLDKSCSVADRVGNNDHRVTPGDALRISTKIRSRIKADANGRSRSAPDNVLAGWSGMRSSPLASQHAVALRTRRRRPLDLRRGGHKRIAEPLDRPDKQRPPRVVAERAPDVSNEHRHIPIGHERVRP